MAKRQARPNDQWIRDLLDVQWLTIEGDLCIPYQPHVDLDGASEGLPVDVELDVREEEGRLVIDRLTISRRPGELIDSTVMRELQLPALLGRVLRFGAGGFAGGLVRKRGRNDFVSVDLSDFDETDRAVVTYRLAYAIGVQPTAAVAENLGISQAAAAKRIERLRAAGRLGATEPGRKGV